MISDAHGINIRMKIREIIDDPYRDGLELDYDIDFDDDIGNNRNPPARRKAPSPELQKHLTRKDRISWREKQRQRYRDEQDVDVEKTRHIPKSSVKYRAGKDPLIRFGKFGKRSSIGFDPEFRDEMLAGATHESGVSCYFAHQQGDKYLIIEPNPARSIGYSHDVLSPILGKFKQQMIRYLDQGVPMDIFLIRGHLVSFGRDKEWLAVGSDGEPLLDAYKPFTSERIAPERVMINRMTLVEYFDKKWGLDRIRKSMQDPENLD